MTTGWLALKRSATSLAASKEVGATTVGLAEVGRMGRTVGVSSRGPARDGFSAWARDGRGRTAPLGRALGPRP